MVLRYTRLGLCPKCAKVTRLFGQEEFLPEMSGKIRAMSNWFTRRIKKAAEVAEELFWGALIVSVLGLVWVYYEGLRGGPMYIAIGFFSAVILIVAAALILKFIRSRYTRKTIEGLVTEDKRNIGELTEQVRLLTQEREAVEKARDGAIKAHVDVRRENERLQDLAQMHSVSADVHEQELKAFKAKYKWLHERADIQCNNISNYIELVEIRWCYEELETGLLVTVFALDIFNKSLFDIAIEKEVGGLIDFDGTDLLEKKRIKNHPVTCKPAGTASITLEQRLSPSEAHLIKSRDIQIAGFYLEHLIITIKSSNDYPLKPQPLQINQRGRLLRSNQSVTEKLSEEIKTLKAQHTSALLDFNKRMLIVDRLARFVVMGQEYFYQSQSGKPISKVNLAAWLERAASEIKRFLGDDAVKEFYDNSDVAPPPPDTLDSQMEWVRRYCTKANAIIKQQYHHLDNDK